MECLSDELLELIMLRFSLLSARVAKRVCKKWKQMMDSTRFRESYSSGNGLGTAIVEQGDDVSSTTFKLIDDCSSTATLSGTVSCLGKGQILWYSPGKDDWDFKLYFGNLVTNKWDELPRPFSFLTQSLVLKQLLASAGHQTLVWWDIYGAICTLHHGQTVWDRVLEQGKLMTYQVCTTPVLMNSTTMVCLDKCPMLQMRLLEYDCVHDSLCSRPLVISGKLHPYPGRNTTLVVWQDKLYMLSVAALLYFRVWAVSTEGKEDATATLVSECKMMRTPFYYFLNVAVDKNQNLLHCYGCAEGMATYGTYELLYDMEKKTLLGDPKFLSPKLCTYESVF